MLSVFALASLGACSSDEILAKQVSAPQEQVPQYRTIIGDALSAKKPGKQISQTSGTPAPLPQDWEIANPESYAPFEISAARQVQSFQGWAWLVCLKGVKDGRPAYFGVFIQHNQIINIRGNIAIDRCPEQSYEPLPLSIPATAEDVQSLARPKPAVLH